MYLIPFLGRLLKAVFLSTLLVVTRSSNVISMETSSSIHLPQFDNLFLSVSVLDKLQAVDSLIACSVLCAANQECGSFFYLEVGGQRSCQTHRVLFTSTERAKFTPGARYYQLTQDWCPHQAGYILHRKLSLCYRYVNQKQTWESALTSCDKEGGHLLWVTSSEVADHMKLFLLTSSSEWRIQHVSVGIQMTNGRDWTMTSGQRVTFTDWAAGEPSSAKENCVVLAWFYNFRWNDAPCTGHRWAWLCQRDKTTNVLL